MATGGKVLNLKVVSTEFVKGKVQNVILDASSVGGIGGNGLAQVRAFPSASRFHGLPANRDTSMSYGEFGLASITGADGGANGWGSGSLGLERVGAGAATGDQTTFLNTGGIGADTSDDTSFVVYKHIPANFSDWDTDAIRIRTKIADLIIVGSTQTARIRLEIYNPTTGAVAVTKSRTATSSDSAYVWLTASDTDLSGIFSGGQLMKLKVICDHTVIGDGTTEFHLGEIQLNWT